MQLEEQLPDEAGTDEGEGEGVLLPSEQQEYLAISALIDTLTPPTHTCGRCLALVFESEMREAVSGPYRNNWVCVDLHKCDARLLGAGSRRKRKAPVQSNL